MKLSEFDKHELYCLNKDIHIPTKTNENGMEVSYEIKVDKESYIDENGMWQPATFGLYEYHKNPEPETYYPPKQYNPTDYEGILNYLKIFPSELKQYIKNNIDLI